MAIGKHTPGTHVQKVIDGLALVYRQPRTVPEIAEITGSKRDSVRRWLDTAAAEGLIEKTPHTHSGHNGRQPAVYRWVHIQQEPKNVTDA